MYVNGFWLGVLMVIVAEIIFIIIGALINTIRHKDDPEEDADLMMTEEEFRATIENAIRASVDEVIREKFDNGKEE